MRGIHHDSSVMKQYFKTSLGIPESDIEKRYVETFMQLNTVLKECNLIAFYDNTESFRRFAIYKNGELVRISSNVPTWFSKVEILK